ncbi:MAG: GLPGLI family protein [Deltaproteobacteria bacterium]
MKTAIKTLLFSIMFLTTFKSYGQSITQGTITYLQSSNWTKMMTSLDYLTQNQKDRMMYMSSNRPGWKQYKILYFNENNSKFEDSDEEADNEFRGWSQKKQVYFIKNDKEKNSIQSVQTLNGKDYLINDHINHPKWKILNNLKEVAGHICMNATAFDTIKKQNIEAWFALDIPVSWGPVFYSGLPGLILEIDINNGAVILTAEKIENTLDTKNFEIPKKIKAKKINLSQFNKLIYDHIAEKRKTEQPWFWGVPYM